VPLTALALALAVSACSSASPSSSSALAGKSASQVLALALHNATRAATVHFSVETKNTGFNQKVVGDVGPSGGDVVVSSPTSGLHIVVNGRTGYLQADATSLQAALGLAPSTASAYAHKWISVAPGDAQYSQVQTAASFPSTLAEFTPGGHLRLSTKVIAGHTLGFINGVGSSSVVLKLYQVALAVTTTPPVLPVAAVVSVQGNAKSGTQSAVFTRWGEAVNDATPPNTTPLSTIVHG
jgi:hypothetical protein